MRVTNKRNEIQREEYFISSALLITLYENLIETGGTL